MPQHHRPHCREEDDLRGRAGGWRRPIHEQAGGCRRPSRGQLGKLRIPKRCRRSARGASVWDAGAGHVGAGLLLLILVEADVVPGGRGGGEFAGEATASSLESATTTAY